MTFKIAHLSTSSRGGAAIAAQELSDALSNKGIDSTLISREDLDKFKYGSIKKFSNEILGKIVTQVQVMNTRPPFGVTTPISISNLDIIKLLRKNFDLIHIHNWYNLLSVKDMSAIAQSMPLVFTLHDERLLTGGCHTTVGCKSFEISCSECPAVKTNKSGIVRSKRELNNILSLAPNMSAITPSKWIVEQIRNAGLEKNFVSLAHIPNLISSEYFSQEIPVKGQGSVCKLLFISADIGIEIKGLKLLLEALDVLTTDNSSSHLQDIELHLVGAGELPERSSKNYKVIHHGFKVRQEIRALISQSTFLVVPSLSENSPNVIAEAQLMGLPVIASDVAGIPELIQDSVTGFLAQTNPEDLSKALKNAFASRNLREIALQAHSSALVRYDISTITQAHIDLYQKALARR
jgi:glycosyltransferase involved in cell wall biosynthesis